MADSIRIRITGDDSEFLRTLASLEDSARATLDGLAAAAAVAARLLARPRRAMARAWARRAACACSKARRERRGRPRDWRRPWRASGAERRHWKRRR